MSREGNDPGTDAKNKWAEEAGISYYLKEPELCVGELANICNSSITKSNV